MIGRERVGRKKDRKQVICVCVYCKLGRYRKRKREREREREGKCREFSEKEKGNEIESRKMPINIDSRLNHVYTGGF